MSPEEKIRREQEKRETSVKIKKRLVQHLDTDVLHDHNTWQIHEIKMNTDKSARLPHNVFCDMGGIAKAEKSKLE